MNAYHRIILLGNNGSGKSYFARQLHAVTGLPLIHLDREFWRPGWEMPTQEEWMRKNREFIAQEQWIIDGMVNHGGTMELRFAAADLVIFLDVNRFICMAGVIQRAGKPRADMPDYLWHSRGPRFWKLCMRALKNDAKRSIMALHEKYPDKPFLVVKGRNGMRRLIKTWGDTP